MTCPDIWTRKDTIVGTDFDIPPEAWVTLRVLFTPVDDTLCPDCGAPWSWCECLLWPNYYKLSEAFR